MKKNPALDKLREVVAAGVAEGGAVYEVPAEPRSDYDVTQDVKNYCADVAEREPGENGKVWTVADGVYVAGLFNQAKEPWGLFYDVDAGSGVGRTLDGREWFHVLRQMRNTPGSGLFENLRGR